MSDTSNTRPLPWLINLMKAIKDASFHIHQHNVKVGFYTDLKTMERLDRNIPEMLCLIHSEVSEAMEGYRKNLPDDKLPDRPMIEVELADAIIRILDLGEYMGLDVGGAVADKFIFNLEREDHKLENRAKENGKKF